MQLAVGLCGCDAVLGQPGSASDFSFSLTLFSCYSQESARRGTEVIGLSVLFVPEIHTNKTWWMGLLFCVCEGTAPSVGGSLWSENLSQCGLYLRVFLG